MVECLSYKEEVASPILAWATKGIMNKIATYRGKSLEEYTKEEPIEILNHLCEYYENRLEGLRSGLKLISDSRKV